MNEESITMREALMLDIEDLKRERDEARDERNNWRRDCLEQCRLLAMSADREEKLRTDLMLARKLADSAMLEADRLRAQLHKQ